MMKSFRVKSFDVELQDLSRSATVFYEGAQVYLVKDECGREWTPRELSIFDLNEIEKNLVQHLLANEQASAACEYCGKMVCE